MPDFVISTNIDQFLKSMGKTEKQLHKATRKSAEHLGKETTKLYAGTARTWNNKPDFTVEINGRADRIEVLAGTDSKIYGYVDLGTRVRRAIMSSDWRSKTKPGSLKSGAGRGSVVFISKKVNRPGIRARGFSEKIKQKIERKVEGVFNRFIKKAIR